MSDSRSNEIIKNLNRLANDRTLPPNTRNKVRDAARHMKELHDEVEGLRETTLCETRQGEP